MRIQSIFTSLRSRSLRFQGFGTRPVGPLTECFHTSADDPNHELFRYTSGRWIFNEELRLSERYLKFNVSALEDTIAAASGRPHSDIVSFFKLAEGGFNRIFQADFKDGKSIIARLPYPATTPKQYTVANEAATLDYLRLHGFPTPKVYAWCSTKQNPVGSEYMIMEKMGGTPLGDIWYSMTRKEQYNIVRQIVEWEAKLMSLEFPGFGSLYYRKDLRSENTLPLPDDRDAAFCMGPLSHYTWWHGERQTLDIDRGPWLSSVDIFRAAAERELTWTKLYGKPRQPYERVYREIYNFTQLSPDNHIKNLEDYLKLLPSLGFKTGTPLHRPVLRHPDLQPNNILVSDEKQIIGFIDWQHCTILPLGIVAGIPGHFQNYGDPGSENLGKPQLDLPPNYDSLPPSEQALARETQRRRVIHFLYAALTMKINEEHYDAIFDNPTIFRQKLFKYAGSPWEGDSITLRAEMIRAVQNWAEFTSADGEEGGSGDCSTPPIQYSEKDVKETLALDERQNEADEAMDQMRQLLDVDVLGWIPNDQYKATKQMAHDIKAKMVEVAATPSEAAGIKDHFPFDDFDEDA